MRSMRVSGTSQMIATAMGVFKTVGQSQNQAKTVAGNLVKGGKQDASSTNTSESGNNKNEVVKSVLESFEKTQQKH